MSFTKRNTVLSSSRPGQTPVNRARAEIQLAPGVRPSPLDGRLTTSTGTSSLDQLLAGHGGLPLGTCLLVEEQGTTDFSGILLRYYAAEGLVQGHQVHTVALPQEWRQQLPAVAAPDSKSKTAKSAAPVEEKMKIAWRYGALGNSNTAPNTRGDTGSTAVFCHTFDLSKRLAISSCKGSLNPLPSTFNDIIKQLRAKIEASGPAVIHRLVVSSLLSPIAYPPGCGAPSEVLQFLHALRALLRDYGTQLTALITLPTSLFPRDSGLVRWMELLCDGVVELIPLPANPAAAAPTSAAEKAEQVQGLLRVHTLPVYHEKGGGGGETSHFRENLSFNLSASKGLVIKPYSLPPMLEEEQKEKSPASTVKDGLDF